MLPPIQARLCQAEPPSHPRVKQLKRFLVSPSTLQPPPNSSHAALVQLRTRSKAAQHFGEIRNPTCQVCPYVGDSCSCGTRKYRSTSGLGLLAPRKEHGRCEPIPGSISPGQGVLSNP